MRVNNTVIFNPLAINAILAEVSNNLQIKLISYQKNLLDSLVPDSPEYWEIKSNLNEAIEQLSLEV